MYEAYFGLKRLPFQSTPDPSDYFPAASHESAFEDLQRFFNECEGFAIISGPAGVGKTLLAHRLLDVLLPTQQPIFLTNPHGQSVSAMFQSVLYDLSLPFEGATEQELRLRVTDFIMDRFANGERTVLMVDEAQHLSKQQCEELRLLTNLESRRIKAVQIVLLGQPMLTSLLDRPEMEPLAQRIGTMARLTAFTNDECLEYVHSQVLRVGGEPDSILTADGLAEICERSAGIPRRINQLAHRALMLAFLSKSSSIDAEVVAGAAEQLFLPRIRRTLVLHHADNSLQASATATEGSAKEIEPDIEVEKPHVIEIGGESDTDSPIELHAAPAFSAFGSRLWPTGPKRA